jgi:hypothetical protein
MKYRELMERQRGLFLFFVWFLLATLANLTPIAAVVDRSILFRRALLIVAAIATVLGVSFLD